jgi:putative ABC transport system substrate-binding protein
MKRREFIALVGAVAAWPVTARAQQDAAVRRIGVLTSLAESDPEQQARLARFRDGLERLGWSEGRNLRIEYRFAPAASADQAQIFARELLALHPDIIVAQSTAVAAALQRETSTTPIIFVNISDPIGSGFVSSLARPGGNLTGLLLYEASITGKWLAMLKEIAPHLTRASLIGNPKTTPYDYFLRGAQTVAPALGLELIASRVETSQDIERAIVSFAHVPNGGLVFPSDATINVHRDLVIQLAAQHRLPAVYAGRYFVAQGGLMSYDTDRADMFRQAAFYVDRILRGAKPADLPVQAPGKYETAINLKTAKVLGLTVPPGLLVAADEVIE